MADVRDGEPPKLKIALVAPLVTPITELPIGGVHTFLVDLARGLRRRGHDLELYCAAPSRLPGVELVQIPVPPGLEAALVAMSGVSRRVPAMRDAFAALYAEVRRRGPDAVTQHSFDAEAIELASGLPVLHTLHLPPIVPAVVSAARASKARFCVPSDAARKAWEQVGLEGPAVVPNGVPAFEPAPGRPRQLALVAGRISPEKGVDVALRVAERLGLERLVVGPIYDRDYFETAVRPLLRPGELRPTIPREQVWELMAGSAVLLAPVDWEEPYGLSAAEAQVAGCPVAGFARGALPEIVEQGVSGLLAPPRDFEGLVEATHRALALDRARVRESALRRLSLERSLDAYETALARLVRRPAAG